MTAPAERLDILHHFRQVGDPRDTPFVSHPLGDLLLIALCATLSGSASFAAVAEFGRAKEQWLRSLGLTLPNGPPSHDTFRDLFRHLDPAAFQAAFASWVEAACAEMGVDHVQIDGKALRGSRGVSGTCLHLVSAWVGANSLTLGQVACEEKSNEITAIPKLLRMLELKGALVTIDAMGCQKEIASQVRERGADYLLAVKENQGRLYEDVCGLFRDYLDGGGEGIPVSVAGAGERGHGRGEWRGAYVFDELSGIRDRELWRDLSRVVVVLRERDVKGGVSQEASYYISSRAASAEAFLGATRGHWGIENGLHWTLDVTFREDDCRVKDRRAAQNLGLLRRVAVSGLRQDTSEGSVRTKVYRAALDDRFREKILRKMSGRSA